VKVDGHADAVLAAITGTAPVKPVKPVKKPATKTASPEKASTKKVAKKTSKR
jgi:hypothetical protein